jgi:hypothetical protein
MPCAPQGVKGTDDEIILDMFRTNNFSSSGGDLYKQLTAVIIPIMSATGLPIRCMVKYC